MPTKKLSYNISRKKIMSHKKKSLRKKVSHKKKSLRKKVSYKKKSLRNKVSHKKKSLRKKIMSHKKMSQVGKGKMSREYCIKTPCKKMGFSQKASCRKYKNCYI